MKNPIPVRTLVYSNDDKKNDLGNNAPRISRDLVGEFFRAFDKNLRSETSISFFKKTRIPNERELYGMILKSLFDAELNSDLGYIATEFQVGRSDDAKGRVDIFFNCRDTSLLVEFKVARVGLAKGISSFERSDQTGDLVAKIVDPWSSHSIGNEQGVVSQLQALNTKSLSTCLKLKLVKLPVVLYLYIGLGKNGPREKWKSLADSTHEYIIHQLNHEPPQFEFRSILDEPIRTRKRRTPLDSEADLTLYGFSLIASELPGNQ